MAAAIRPTGLQLLQPAGDKAGRRGRRRRLQEQPLVPCQHAGRGEAVAVRHRPRVATGAPHDRCHLVTGAREWVRHAGGAGGGAAPVMDRLAPLPGAHDRSTAGRLYHVQRRHAFDPAEGVELAETQLQRQYVGAAAGRDENPVGRAPAERLGNLERQGLLALDAIQVVGLGGVEPAVALGRLLRQPGALHHVAVHHQCVGAADLVLQQVARHRLRAHECGELESGARTIGAQGGRRVAGGGEHQPLDTHLPALAYGDAGAAVLERATRIARFVLDEKTGAAKLRTHALHRQQRRVALLQ